MTRQTDTQATHKLSAAFVAAYVMLSEAVSAAQSSEPLIELMKTTFFAVPLRTRTDDLDRRDGVHAQLLLEHLQVATNPCPLSVRVLSRAGVLPPVHGIERRVRLQQRGSIADEAVQACGECLRCVLRGLFDAARVSIVKFEHEQPASRVCRLQRFERLACRVARSGDNDVLWLLELPQGSCDGA